MCSRLRRKWRFTATAEELARRPIWTTSSKTTRRMAFPAPTLRGFCKRFSPTVPRSKAWVFDWPGGVRGFAFFANDFACVLGWGFGIVCSFCPLVGVMLFDIIRFILGRKKRYAWPVIWQRFGTSASSPTSTRARRRRPSVSFFTRG